MGFDSNKNNLIKSFALASGSSGNCFYIEYLNKKILVDCGLTFQKTQEILDEKGINLFEITDIFITHEHSDHIAGLKVMLEKLDCSFYATKKTIEVLEFDLNKFNVICEHEIINLDEVRVLVLAKPHDGVESVSYVFDICGKKIGFFTDLGHVNFEILNYLKQLDLVYFEVNYSEEYIRENCLHMSEKYLHRLMSDYGHLGLHQAKDAIEEFVKDEQIVVLSHISENTISYSLAYNSIKEVIDKKGISCELKMSFQGEASEVFELRILEDMNLKESVSQVQEVLIVK